MDLDPLALSVSRPHPFPKPRLHPDHLVDEVVALLMTTHGLKLSLIELTKKYNASFRSVASPVDDIELLHGIQQLSNFKVCSFQLAKPLLHVGTALG